jgi:hypothetical protein
VSLSDSKGDADEWISTHQKDETTLKSKNQALIRKRSLIFGLA